MLVLQFLRPVTNDAFEFPFTILQCPDTKSVHSEDKPCQGQHAQCEKPPRLIEVRLQRYQDAGPCLIPKSIIIASQDAKVVFTRRQVHIVCRTLGSGIHPILVKAFKFVFE